MKILKKFLTVTVCVALIFSIVGCTGSQDDTADSSSKQKLPGATVVDDNNMTAVNRSDPQMISTKYNTYDNVIADVIATEFGADSSGNNDSTQALTMALNYCGANGGGTVWLPAGKYLITSGIVIPSCVTLRGDWQDPDTGNDYGTVIIADIPENDSETSGLIRLSASSGVNGLTVFYKNQTIENVKKYGFTFYVSPCMLATIKNCTIINGYRGIGTTTAGAHEQLTIKNVKGTILKTGIAINNSSDVGTIDGVTFSSKYWANAGASVQKADASKIEAYTKSNGEGLYITDAEQQQMYDITLSGFKYGILYPAVETRYMGSGSFYGLNITNCQYGVYAKSGTYKNNLTNIDFRWGYNIANSTIEGSSYSIYNGSSPVDGVSGCFKLSGVTLKGATHGNIQTNSASANLSGFKMNTLRTTKTTGTFFKMLKSGASEEDIQSALDEAGTAGGGVVYIAEGKYTIKNGLSVPANVLLRGKCASPVRIASKGTVFLAEQNGLTTAAKAEKAKALVTLNGDNAGVSGIFFHYSENADILKNGPDIKYFPYAVKGKGKGVYATNLCIVAATHGIDFSGCENYVIEGIQTTCLNNCIKASGGGIVMNCLQNVTVLVRSEYNFSHDEEKFNIFDITRYNTDIVRIENSKGDTVLNCFGYGVKTNINAKKATDLLCVNLGADNIGDNTYMHMFEGGSATVINSLRYNGYSYDNNGCKLKIYNRMGIWAPYEEDV